METYQLKIRGKLANIRWVESFGKAQKVKEGDFYIYQISGLSMEECQNVQERLQAAGRYNTTLIPETFLQKKQALWEGMQAAGVGRESAKKIWEAMQREDFPQFKQGILSGTVQFRDAQVNRQRLYDALEAW